MKLARLYAVVFLLFVVSACAVTGPLFGPTPEAQIKNGADTAAAGAVTGTVLLKNKKVTPATARSYSNLLHAASAHLDDANTRLEACRKSTGSTQKTVPDPCASTVADDIRLGLSIANDVKGVLDKK